MVEFPSGPVSRSVGRTHPREGDEGQEGQGPADDERDNPHGAASPAD
jgi:hypothetical protein